MKRILLSTLALILVLALFSSCAMEEVIPEMDGSFSKFEANEALYRDALDYVQSLGFDCLISRTDFFSPEGSESYTGLYLQNMSDNSFSECDDPSIRAIFSETDVKMISLARVENLTICTFDHCVPRRNFDFGFYYVSEDKPIYFGDPSVSLTETENGFQYEKKVDYGSKFTYFTSKVTENFYYYEIL